jgi:type VI secretion system protein ImpA
MVSVALDLAARMEAVLAAAAAAPATSATAADLAPVSALRAEMRAARARAEALADPTHPDRSLLVPPDWDGLAQAAEALLCRGRLRMEAVAFLMEASALARGLHGLAFAAALLAALVEAHWDKLEPQPAPNADGSPAAPRHVAASLLEPLRVAAGELVPVILRQIVLFMSGEGVAYTIGVVERARRRPAMEARLAEEKKGPRDPRRAASIARLEAELAAPAMRPWDAVAQAARSEQGDVIQQTCGGIRAAQAAWAALENALAGREAGGILPMAPVRDLLASLMSVLTPLMPKAAASPSAEPAPAVSEAAGALPQPPAASLPTPATRQQMLAALSDIAQFFHLTEPQSPVAASIEEVVRRARLSWPELMAELLPGKAERDGVLQRLGIRPAPPG